jgi:hypothetical protein
VWLSFREWSWHSMRRATIWLRLMPWSVWWDKAGQTKSRSRERLPVRRARCGDISGALRPAAWPRWDMRVVTRQITVEDPLKDAGDIYRLGGFLLGRERLVSRPLRLLGLGVASLREPSERQLVLL